MNLSFKEKSYRTELRFRNKKQRNALKSTAKKNGRSMNAELNYIIDMYLVNQYSFIKQKTNETS
jgi:hypothetical protein